GARVGVGVAGEVRVADSVLDRLLGGALQPRVDRQLEAARRTVAPGGAERAHDAPPRVDGHLLAHEAAVEQPVVGGLDARLADHLPGLVAAVAAFGELPRPDLAEDAQELA